MLVATVKFSGRGQVSRLDVLDELVKLHRLCEWFGRRGLKCCLLPASHQSGKWETTTGACGESKGPKNKGKEKKKKKGRERAKTK